MATTLLALLEEKYPHAIKVWDRWNYRISSPISLDDRPLVQVTLENKSGMCMIVSFDLVWISFDLNKKKGGKSKVCNFVKN